jgi:adenine-specific DNA-methyltransferase
MPTLHWIGKEKVINHHRDVPFKVLQHKYGFDNGKQSDKPTNSGNLIIHGDNLEALKALLPQYEGKVDCICIDPPYNTGNEGWVYNDNVNHPKIKKWLGQLVGKESEDLSRHDKWLCMMYPRIKLLHQLLSKNGVIFISIDDNEVNNLKLLCDEIFGSNNFIANFIWKKAAGSQNDAKYVAISHEYIISYSKSKENLLLYNLPLPEKTVKAYKYQDEYFSTRGPYQLRNLHDSSIGDRPGLHYDITCPDGSILNGKDFQWRCDIFKYNKRLDEKRIVFKKEKDIWSVNYKLYLNEEKESLVKDSYGNIVAKGVKPNSMLENIAFNSDASKDIKNIFGVKSFDYSKPVKLIEQLLKLVCGRNSLVLDSFSGSGTTAHALLNLNKKDGGNRKIICIEMEDYAETVTAERVKRVIKGYGTGTKKVEGTGGSFDFYELGLPIFVGDNNEYLNEEIDTEKIREYIWFSETRTPYSKPKDNDSTYFLGKKEDSAYYFIYEKEAETTLDYDMLSEIKTKSNQYVIYADNCLLSKEFLMANNIIFKKIPRDVTRF